MSNHVNIAIRRETRDLLRRLAAAEGRSMSEILSRAVNERLARHKGVRKDEAPAHV